MAILVVPILTPDLWVKLERIASLIHVKSFKRYYLYTAYRETRTFNHRKQRTITDVRKKPITDKNIAAHSTLFQYFLLIVLVLVSWVSLQILAISVIYFSEILALQFLAASFCRRVDNYIFFSDRLWLLIAVGSWVGSTVSKYWTGAFPCIVLAYINELENFPSKYARSTPPAIAQEPVL